MIIFYKYYSPPYTCFVEWNCTMQLASGGLKIQFAPSETHYPLSISIFKLQPLYSHFAAFYVDSSCDFLLQRSAKDAIREAARSGLFKKQFSQCWMVFTQFSTFTTWTTAPFKICNFFRTLFVCNNFVQI